jgi:hypothetical protein
LPQEAQKGCPSATSWPQDQHFAGALTLSIICIRAEPNFLLRCAGCNCVCGFH